MSFISVLIFKFQKLGWNTKLWDIKEPGSWVTFLWLSPNYPVTFLFFGNTWKNPGHSNWILKDPKKNQFHIWYLNKWHHLCLSYESETNFISMVKVSKSIVYEIKLVN